MLIAWCLALVSEFLVFNDLNNLKINDLATRSYSVYVSMYLELYVKIYLYVKI